LTFSFASESHKNKSSYFNINRVACSIKLSISEV